MVWLSHLGDTTERALFPSPPLLSLDHALLVPWVFSISYQDLEYTVTPKFADRVNAEFMKYSSTVRFSPHIPLLTHQGRTFVTGSGDWGVGCKDKDHCDVFTSDFPSCSPYITSLGTSSLLFVAF